MVKDWMLFPKTRNKTRMSVLFSVLLYYTILEASVRAIRKDKRIKDNRTIIAYNIIQYAKNSTESTK
jgi:hypothetical protein